MIRLAIRVPRVHAEVVLAELLELAPDGVEEVDLGPDALEYAIYGAPGELPVLPALEAALGEALLEISTTELPDDWGERWKRFHRPILVEPPEPGELLLGEESSLPPPSLHVRPPWEPPSERTRVQEIVIDPGQAFGTGAHATTRMCLELLLSLAASERVDGPLVDVGAGSGILAITAARLGYGPVLALDNDPESLAAAVSNASINESEIETRRFDLRKEALPHPGAIVVANLLRPLLIDLESSMALAPTHLLASGLLTAEVDEIVTLYEGRLHMRERERRLSGEWGAVWLSRAP